MLEEDEDIKELKDLVGKINAKFKRTSTGKLAKSGTYKSLLSKQNLYNILTELTEYSTFFENTDINIPWIDWKNKGNSYDIGDKCPYCSERLNERTNPPAMLVRME